MKKLIIPFFLLFFWLNLCAQSDTITDKQIREKALTDIQNRLEQKTKSIDSTVSRLDAKLNNLDRAIVSSRSASDKADKLLERVLLEADILELKANPNRAARAKASHGRVER